MSKSRNWCFTRYLSIEDIDACASAELGAADMLPVIPFIDQMVYIIFQLEQGVEERSHLQGFVQFNGPKALAFVKRAIGNEAHCEVAHDVKASIDYCSKEDTRVKGPWSRGTQPAMKPGKRNDLLDMHEAIKAGTSQLALIEGNPKLLKFERCIKYDLFLQLEAKSDRQVAGVNVTVLWGDAGSGKTQYAINHLVHGSYYKLDCTGVRNGNLWFDGYEGQDTLIIDDFDEEVCGVSFLKQLLDVYRHRICLKGGHTWACWHYVLMTSNTHPADWWPFTTVVQKEALKRRIHTILHCTIGYVYRLQNWDRTYIDHDYQFIPPPPARVIVAQLVAPIPFAPDVAQPVVGAIAPPPSPVLEPICGARARGFVPPQFIRAPLIHDMPPTQAIPEVILVPDTQDQSMTPPTPTLSEGESQPPRHRRRIFDPVRQFIDDEAAESSGDVSC